MFWNTKKNLDGSEDEIFFKEERQDNFVDDKDLYFTNYIDETVMMSTLDTDYKWSKQK